MLIFCFFDDEDILSPLLHEVLLSGKLLLIDFQVEALLLGFLYLPLIHVLVAVHLIDGALQPDLGQYAMAVKENHPGKEQHESNKVLIP